MASTIPLTRRSSLLSTTRSTRSHPSPTVIQSLTKRLRSYKPVPHRSPLPFPPKRTIIHDDPPASSGFGPNPLAIPSTPPAQSSSSVASPSASRKGKARVSAPERRVLPARMRRAAGGGSEAVRDLEEMVFDWLERWGGSWSPSRHCVLTS